MPRKARPPLNLTREELYARAWSTPLTTLAASLGLSRNGLAKICDRMLVPYPGRGYWTKSEAARSGLQPPLPVPPGDAAGAIVFSKGRSGSRRDHTRLAPETRREQMLDVAAVIVRAEGLHAATMKRVAREGGLSEAQAHNLFSRRTDLLTELARRELAAIQEAREGEMARAQDNRSRVTLSTIAYLRQASIRGILVQRLLDSPDVRAGLKAEREARSQAARERATVNLQSRYGVDPDIAAAATVVLTGVCLRAGRLVAERKIPVEMAERLSLAMVTAGNRAVMGRRSRQPG